MIPKRIIIVDDNPDICFTIAEICRSQGWIPVTCENHVELFKELETTNPDLFIVDYHLPEMDGVGVVTLIRKRYLTAPIIALTVEETEEVTKRFMEAGANDYALKPFRAIDLIARIKVHLKYRENSRFYIDKAKGIKQETLDRIVSCIAELGGLAKIEQIENGTGISQQSIYRYLKYMHDQEMIDAIYNYAKKAGRPKACYRLRTQESQNNSDSK